MEDRVQVILVLTGIGGSSVDNNTDNSVEDEKIENGEAIELPTFKSGMPHPVAMASSTTNLDIPAFLRRRLT